MAAVILGKLYGTDFAELLRCLVGSAEASWPDSGPVPRKRRRHAHGLAAGILSFVALHLPSQATADPGLHLLREMTFETPSVTFGRSICLGLSDFGGGWFGHNSIYRDSSLLVRFNPERDLAFDRQRQHRRNSGGHRRAHILRQEGTSASARLMSKEQWLGTDTGPYTGRFVMRGIGWK